MLRPDLLEILCCPETRQALRLAEPERIEALNRQIATGALRNRAGQPIKEPLEAGLIRADGQILYPVRHDIPILLIDEGIVIG